MAEEERLRFPHGHRPRLRVKEQDGDPTVEGVREIRVPNAALTDEGKGVVSIDMSAGSGMAQHANEYHDPDMSLATHDHAGVYDPAGTGNTEATDHIATHTAIPGAHHAAVTLGAGSDAALALAGQELTLADVLTPAEHTAIGDSAPHHARSHNHSAAGDGTALAPVTVDASTSMRTDLLYEHTLYHGVEIDGVLCKDDAVETDAIRGLRETTGPTSLAMGAVADGEYLKRDGATLVGGTPAGGGGGFQDAFFLV